MAAITKHALRVYSVLEAMRGVQDDVIDAILPFFEPIMADQANGIFNPEKFAADVRQAYRWNFTADIAEELLPRFEVKGWVRRVTRLTQNAVYDVTYQRSDSADEQVRDITERMLGIAEEFKKFIAVISPLTTYDKTPEQLVEMLVEWLISVDAYNEESLKQQFKHVEKMGNTWSLADLIPEDSSPLSPEDKYLCARFTKHLADSNSPDIGDLCKLASIGLLTEVVQDFNKPVTAINQSDLIIYLDAPVAMDLLGLSGNQAKANVDLILNELLRIGCKIRMFRVSIEELRRVLRAILSRNQIERTGQTAMAIRRGELNERYAAEVRDDPDHFLEQLNIGIVDQTLAQFPGQHSFFTGDQYNALEAAVTWHADPKPREHDATTVTLVMRRRGEVRSRDLFKAKHIFVTRNGYLAQLARRFCIDSGLIGNAQMPPAIHQRQLATLAWLRTGLSHNSEVPKRYLLAACERVLSIKRGVVEKARAEAKKLSTQQSAQLDLLLTKDRSTQILMDKSLGSSSVITEENTADLIEVMKKDLVEEIRTQAEEEKLQMKRSTSAQLGQAGQKVKAEKARADKLEATLEEIRLEDRPVIISVLDAANLRLKIVRWGVNGVASLIVCGGITALVLAGVGTGILQYIAIAVMAVFFTWATWWQLWDRKVGFGGLVQSISDNWFRRLAKQRGVSQKLASYNVKMIDGEYQLMPAQELLPPGTEARTATLFNYQIRE